MSTNLEKYKKDLEALISKGEQLHYAMVLNCEPAKIRAQILESLGTEKGNAFIQKLPDFNEEYQAWYSESKALIRQLLPDRLQDFVRHYETPKSRKALECDTYVLEDFLNGTTIKSYTGEVKVGRSDAIPRYLQQLSILKATRTRFESSLFDVRQLVQADIFDSELDAAKELAKNKFSRAAGAMAGVVLERHLAEVCGNHNINIPKKHPAIGDLNNLLKENGVIDTPTWRFIQHLSDIRNLCDHNKSAEPQQSQVEDLLSGVAKTLKTLF